MPLYRDPGHCAVEMEFTFFERLLNLLGYITQRGSYRLAEENKGDLEHDFDSGLMNVFWGEDYKISNHLKFYG